MNQNEPSPEVFRDEPAVSVPPSDRFPFRALPDVACLDAEMAELHLLLPERHLRALERAARRHGLSTGEMLRRILGAFLHESA